MILPHNRATKETLLVMLDYILDALREIEEEEFEGKPDEYRRGRKAALVECLELLQTWEEAGEHDLDWDIEENFPV